jgi:hypothetical protein
MNLNYTFTLKVLIIPKPKQEVLRQMEYANDSIAPFKMSFMQLPLGNSCIHPLKSCSSTLISVCTITATNAPMTGSIFMGKHLPDSKHLASEKRIDELFDKDDNLEQCL